ncbi:MAG: glycosidase, partial [Planctomycetota bacterium]
MNVFRSPHNPVIVPEDVKPSGDDFEVIGVFNAGVARLKDQIILLLRVAERPINT